jgi:hypothetical protein
MNVPQIPPHWDGLMWGTLPFGSSILAILVLLIPQRKRLERRAGVEFAPDENLVGGRMAS